MDAITDTRRERTDEAARLALVGFILAGAFIGYEWLMSGLTKIVRGGFPAGLADELEEKSAGTVAWYQSFLDGTVIPNARAFAVLIEVGELVIGATLLGAAALMLWRWQRLGYRAEIAVLVAVAAASIGAILMNINFHLANGSPHPWLIPEDGFDEGVDMDSLLPLIELALLVVSTKLLVMLRRGHHARRGVEAEARAPGRQPTAN